MRVLAKVVFFYVTGLKKLKRNFGNPFTVVYIETKLLFDKPQLKHNDRIPLKEFQQQLKCHITWLKPKGYQAILKSPEYLTKAIRRRPNFLRQKFCIYTRNIVINCEDFLSLEQYQIWLENRAKEQYIPVANVSQWRTV